MVRRILWHLDRHPIARFPLGRGGAVAGKVAAASMSPGLRGPLTGQRCAAYQLLIWSMAVTTPPPIVFENCCAPFAIDDGSGLCRVEPRAAEMALRYRRIATGTPGVDLPGDLVAALTRSGVAGPWGPFGFEERSLLPGDWVVACGTGALEPDPRPPAGASYRDRAAGRLVLGASPGFPLAISNDAALRAQPRQTVRLA
jgi:hypothetical protein